MVSAHLSLFLSLSLSRALPLALLHSLVASISIVYPKVVIHTPFLIIFFFALLCSFFVLAYATDSRCVRLIKWSTIRSTVLTSNVCCLSCVRTHALLSSFFFIHTHTPHAYMYTRAHVPPLILQLACSCDSSRPSPSFLLPFIH